MREEFRYYIHLMEGTFLIIAFMGAISIV